MCCTNDPLPNTLEHERFYKLENSSGCCGKNGDCSTPSRAKVDSPLWKWEQQYGKLVNYVTTELGLDGRFYQKIERLPCEKTVETRRGQSCCSLKYKVIR